VEAPPAASVAVEPAPTAEPALVVSASLVTADVATSEAQSEERRGRKRRRRRGRGGRGAEGDTALGTDKSDEAVELAEEDADQVEHAPATNGEAAAPSPAPAVETAAEPATSHGGDGQVAKPREVTATTPSMIVVPTTYSLPDVTPAPMPIEQLQGVLQLAGLSLVQTEPGKFSETQARMAAEPRPVRVPRERPQLPPLDEGPLIQVETRRGQSPSA
jgi:ribonuclease E